MKTFKAKPVKPQVFKGVELKIATTMGDKVGQPGDFLLFGEDGAQYLASAKEVAENFDEVKPRAAKTPTVQS